MPFITLNRLSHLTNHFPRSSDLSRHKVVVTRDLGPEVMSLLRNREGQDIDVSILRTEGSIHLLVLTEISRKLVLWDKEEPCPREWFLKNVPGASALVVLLSEKVCHTLHIK